MITSAELQMSVTQYSIYAGITRQAVLLQIKENRLPENVKSKKIGNIYILTVRLEEKTNKK